ncbi:hypothetical protein PATSB16_12780 [Pandoraea thiooxydans]|uniref:Uncharacterized protein n=1 Tax=Pandoraea thiooxydans TaxID=445709 RepID=A0A0G3EKI3_9BURK|nr:hypothetical protein [Pandoraea thiooxydans]AKJ67543.1 hypothetical protein ABW99_04195 [Pandoraea thiooxydans]APR94620.1 hypothetical protein PATSB16_12780 [Pandoraea thiooxydans]
MSIKTLPLSKIAIAAAASLGMALSISSSAPNWLASIAPVSSAHAQSGTSKGQGGPGADRGSKGKHGSSTEPGASGSGQGGPSSDSDAKGPKYGGGGSKPAPGTQGGKPAWAQEGIPSDLELGRLNVARAPSHVLDRSLADALSSMQPAFYNQVLAIADNASLTMDQKVAALQTLVKSTFTDTSIVMVDSPLQNLALYKDMLSTGQIVSASGTYDANTATRSLLLAAVFIGTASDKTLPVSTATVDAVNKIMSLTLPAGVSDADLGAAAEAVRAAIAEAHG